MSLLLKKPRDGVGGPSGSNLRPPSKDYFDAGGSSLLDGLIGMVLLGIMIAIIIFQVAMAEDGTGKSIPHIRLGLGVFMAIMEIGIPKFCVNSVLRFMNFM